ncbi:hypothetical protein RRG08_031877 [Elysia crispata]|uniref:Uncharacterized protein n=1 Tax=Elysia crispata TaxID=231223 RepID=A0AAE1AIA5_9GAST|nr:hypothetical protein RRG08_031877 [Elysia crispata]
MSLPVPSRYTEQTSVFGETTEEITMTGFVFRVYCHHGQSNTEDEKEEEEQEKEQEEQDDKEEEEEEEEEKRKRRRNKIGKIGP